MRLLLTGKNGQVGFELQRALAPLGNLVALDRAFCDLEDETSIRHSVRSFAPDFIINAAAYTAVDKAESDEQRARVVNALAPAILGEEAKRVGAFVVHYSTDYVFDGKAEGFYRETDPVAPQSVYGQTKLEGEAALAATGARHIIVRTSWVLGAYGSNFAKTMLRLAYERETLQVVSDQIGAPTSAALIADVTAHAIRAINSTKNTEMDGVYHLAAAGETTWYDYASHVIEYARSRGKALKIAPNGMRPITTADYPTPAKRPVNSRLHTQKIREVFNLNLPDWKNGVDHVLQQILQGAP